VTLADFNPYVAGVQHHEETVACPYRFHFALLFSASLTSKSSEVVIYEVRTLDQYIIRYDGAQLLSASSVQQLSLLQ